MGAAKRRGTYEERKRAAMLRGADKAHAEKAHAAIATIQRAPSTKYLQLVAVVAGLIASTDKRR